MRNSKSVHQERFQYNQQQSPNKASQNQFNKDFYSFQKTINELILKSDILQKETNKLSKMVQKLQHQNRQLKNRLKDMQHNSKKSMQYTSHEQFAEVPSFVHCLSQQRISHVETYQGQYNEQISLLDGIQQQNDLQESDRLKWKSKLKLDLSTIKKKPVYKKEMTKFKSIRQNKPDVAAMNQHHQYDELKSEIYSQYRSSFYLDSLQHIKAELIAFKLFFQKTYGQQFSDFVLQSDRSTQQLLSKVVFTHRQIESSKKIKQHLTNENNMLRQRNNRYNMQLKRTQEQLADIKNCLIDRLSIHQHQQ